MGVATLVQVVFGVNSTSVDSVHSGGNRADLRADGRGTVRSSCSGHSRRCRARVAKPRSACSIKPIGSDQ